MIRIPSLRFRQADTILYIGTISASELCDIGVIESWDPDKGWDIDQQGYQRESYKDHYKSIAKFLRDNPNALLPTSVLLSARTHESGVLNFDVMDEHEDHPFGYLEIPDARLLYIVDGQHRMLGFKHAIEEFGKPGLGDYVLPVVVLCDADKVEELSQFHLINDKQKRIATNLALALLGTVVEDQPNIAKMLLGSKNTWKMKPIMIAIVLNEDKEHMNVWSGRIGLPNEPAGTVFAVSLASFVNSLKPFFLADYPHKLENVQLMDYLVRFWAALNSILPKGFESPRDYVVQRTTGVYSFNRVAAELARQKSHVLGAPSKDIELFLRADRVHMKDSMWIAKGELAAKYRGHQRFRDLADEILEEMGLEPSRPKKA